MELEVLERIWAVLVEECEEPGGVNWEWQPAALRQAQERYRQGPFWGDSTSRNPTDRGKVGSKRNVVVDGSGGPLSVVVAGANVYDTKLLTLTLDGVVVERPDGGQGTQHLCLDKGFDNLMGHQAVAPHGYRGHIWRIGEEKLDAKGVKRYPARRWAVERDLFPGNWSSRNASFVE